LFEQAALLAGVEPLQRTTQLVDMPGRDRPSRERVAQVRSALGDLGALQRACRITATGSQGCRQVGVRSHANLPCAPTAAFQQAAVATIS
jgi:hypothetical protein